VSPTMKLMMLLSLLVCNSSAGVWRSSPPPTEPSMIAAGLEGVTSIISGIIRLTGNVLPLRGFAGLMADAGVPGARWFRNVLTPSHLRGWERMERQPNFRDDLLFMVGAVLGEQECVRKLACRSGKRVSSIPGSSVVTMILAGASGYVPEFLRETYSILRDSVLYSDDCEQFFCRPR